MSTDKRLEKIRKAFKLSDEPSLNPMDYKASLVFVLNYYNTNYDNKKKRSWFLQYTESLGVKNTFDHVHDREFRVAGSLARLTMVEAPLEQNEIDLLNSEIERIKNIQKPKIVQTDEEPKKPEVDRNLVKAKEVLAEFAGLVDDYCTERKLPNIESFVRQMNMTGGAGHLVAQSLQKRIDEVQEALKGDDKDLSYAWGFLTRPELKKFLAFHVQMVEKCSQAKRIINRQPRKRKEISPVMQVSKMKYCVKHDELNLRSVHPSNIIGAREVYVYHVEARKLQKYEAVENMTLTVRGTTILNFDEKKSHQKNIRKPETIRSCENQGKRFINNFLKEIRATELRVNGRMSDGSLILAAFK